MRNTHVCYAQIPFIINDQVLGLDIPMYDPVRMQILQPDYHTARKELYYFLRKIFVNIRSMIKYRF
jgi:hypothetical protein